MVLGVQKVTLDDKSDQTSHESEGFGDPLKIIDSMDEKFNADNKEFLKEISSNSNSNSKDNVNRIFTLGKDKMEKSSIGE